MDKTRYLGQLHAQVHAIRMMDNYKCTKFEWLMNKTISEAFADECEECKLKAEQYKYQQPPAKKGFLAGVFGG
jgi:urease accessory protein UreH